MKIAKDTDSYNDRRYGKPWIAKVDFSTGVKGEFSFGEWCGQSGDAGTLYLDCEPGDVVATGQKDSRKPSNSTPEYHVVGDDGTLTAISKPDAYKHWQERSKVVPHDDAVDARKAFEFIAAQCEKLPMVYETGGARINAQQYNELRSALTIVSRFLK